MRLGILADVHEEVENLQAALDAFGHEGVDRFVVLGDVFDSGQRIEETVALLREVEPVGVWGNHELGLCHEPSESLLARHSQEVVDFFATLAPRVAIDAFHFSHVTPTWDATDPAVFYLGPKPWNDGIADVFESLPHRAFFVGHFHCWYAATPTGPLDWAGETALPLPPGQRRFVVVHAVKDGWCAVLDTDANELTPIAIG